MKIKSQNKLPLVQTHGRGFLISFDEAEITLSPSPGTLPGADPQTGFEYEQCFVCGSPTRQEIIEAMIATRYTTGAEFAAINNAQEDPQGYDSYQQFRVLVKAGATIVESWLNAA